MKRQGWQIYDVCPPEEDGVYIVTDCTGEVFPAEFDAEGGEAAGTFGLSIGCPDDKDDGLWFINCGERCAVNDDIKAWAPLPEPYKEESDG